MKNKPAVVFLVLFLLSAGALVWQVTRATHPPSIVQPGFGQLLASKGAEPAGDLGEALDPGTVLDRRGGGLAIHADPGQAFVYPAQLSPRGPTSVLAQAACQDRIEVAGTVDADLLGALGLDALQAGLQSRGVAVVETRITNLTRTEISNVQIERAQLQADVLSRLGRSPTIQLVQVVFRADNIDMRYLTAAGHVADAQLGLEGLGVGGSYEHESRSEGWVRYGPRVVGYQPALLFDPLDEMGAETRARYEERLAESGLRFDSQGGHVVVAGGARELRLAAGLAELVLAEREVDQARTELSDQQTITAGEIRARQDAEQRLQRVEADHQELQDRVEQFKEELRELPELRHENQELRESMKGVLDSQILRSAVDQTRSELELDAGSDPAVWKSRFESRRGELARRGVDVGLAERRLQDLQALERARKLVDG